VKKDAKLRLSHLNRPSVAAEWRQHAIGSGFHGISHPCFRHKI